MQAEWTGSIVSLVPHIHMGVHRVAGSRDAPGDRHHPPAAAGRDGAVCHVRAVEPDLPAADLRSSACRDSLRRCC